ncbi:unnamed protein product [Peniophora sp. CBMAI 1063]|nr:unnamed protein product [Peniophora sp. CBMAI 1063]
MNTDESEPLLSVVAGVAIEYIDGVTLEHFVLGETISAEQAERVTQGTLTSVRAMRDALVVHDDIFLRNVMLRRTPGGLDYDYDHPVIIDFGISATYTPKEIMENPSSVGPLGSSVMRARKLFSRESWHIPSLYLSDYAPSPWYGYREANERIEGLSAEHRERFFEEIPENEREAPKDVVDDDDGEVYVYVPARWRVREGARDAGVDLRWRPEGIPLPSDTT